MSVGARRHEIVKGKKTSFIVLQFLKVGINIPQGGKSETSVLPKYEGIKREYEEVWEVRKSRFFPLEFLYILRPFSGNVSLENYDLVQN